MKQHKIELPQGDDEFVTTIAASYGDQQKRLESVVKFKNDTDTSTVRYRVTSKGKLVFEFKKLCLAIASYNRI